MDIKGPEIRFTPSEAHWAQAASARFGSAPKLAQRIQDARVAWARQWLGEDELPPSVATTRHDAAAHLRHARALGHLFEVELDHAIDKATGQEKAVVAVRVSHLEKVRLFGLARIDYGIAQEQIDAPEIVEAEDQLIWDHFAMTAATSDAMEPEEAVALGDMLRDPEILVDHYAAQHKEAVREVALLGPMLTALEFDLAP